MSDRHRESQRSSIAWVGTQYLADRNINVIDMINKSRDELAYNLIDIEASPEEELADVLRAVDDVISVRLIP